MEIDNWYRKCCMTCKKWGCETGETVRIAIKKTDKGYVYGNKEEAVFKPTMCSVKRRETDKDHKCDDYEVNTDWVRKMRYEQGEKYKYYTEENSWERIYRVRTRLKSGEIWID